MLTLLKDKQNQENRFRRVNVRRVVPLEELAKLNYNNVHIEIDNVNNLEKLYETIKEKGETKINISIIDENKNYLFELKNKRKFDYEMFKNLNKQQYIKKIRV